MRTQPNDQALYVIRKSPYTEKGGQLCFMSSSETVMPNQAVRNFVFTIPIEAICFQESKQRSLRTDLSLKIYDIENGF